MITFTQKHWNHIEIPGPNDCWIWTGSNDGKGYGHIRKNGKLLRVSRIMLAWVDGIEIPNRDVFILHSCDTPECVNPFHLRWGTAEENSRDASERKRLKNNFKFGEQHSHAKLVEVDVLEIRKLSEEGLTQLALSDRYGVSRRTINHIVNRVTWTHI